MPSAIRTLLRWSLRCYAAYLLLCLLLIMPALNIMAPRLVKSALHRELGSELFFFNPFTLTLEGRGVTITEHDGHVPLGFERLQINLSLESLWSPGVVLDGFYLDELDLHVLRDADGRFHFADLLQSSPETPDPEKDSTLFPITIHDLRIEAHTLRFTDATRPGPYTTAQTDLRIRTQNLTTVPDRQSEGDLVVTGNRGGQLRWRGELHIHGGRSDGQLILENVDLTPLWLYDAETLPFVVNSARLDAVLNYTVDWSRDLQATLNNSEIRLHEVDVIPASVDLLPDTGVSLRELAISGVQLDLAKQDLALAALTVEGLKLSGFDEDGEPSLLAMFVGDQQAASVPGPSGESSIADASDTADNAADKAADNASASETAWTVALANFDLSDSGVTWRTGYLAPEVMRITPLTAKATSIRWPAQGDAPYQLALSINETSSLEVDGRLNISSGDGKTHIALQNWSLPWLNPLVNEQTRATIGRGNLSLESTLSLAAFAPTQINARITIDDYSTILEESGEEAFTFAALSVDGIAVDIPKQSLGIESIALNRPSGSLHIRNDGTINVNGIVRGNDDQSTAGDEEQDNNNDDEGAPWRVQLTHFSLRDGRLDFADASLPLHFQTVIGGIDADVRDVDTASEQALKVELKGAVDGYAPVVILASGKPFATRRDGELQFTFRGMDIASMSPYSGTYAGYTIDS
ncbi:MAG: DUF748 domain-containing protein, partial [Congregibacter sp.]|nr:DUF748 domain-containing protein [Congregibacter sp.]